MAQCFVIVVYKSVYDLQVVVACKVYCVELRHLYVVAQKFAHLHLVVRAYELAEYLVLVFVCLVFFEHFVVTDDNEYHKGYCQQHCYRAYKVHEQRNAEAQYEGRSGGDEPAAYY